MRTQSNLEPQQIKLFADQEAVYFDYESELREIWREKIGHTDSEVLCESCSMGVLKMAQSAGHELCYNQRHRIGHVVRSK